MEVTPGSVISDGNGAKPPKGGGKPAKGEKPRGAAKANGRKDAEKQPAAKQPKVIAERLDELVHLHQSAKLASEDLATAITKAAEDSGYLASAVRKIVTAKAGEKYEEAKRVVEQQFELFEEIA